jgi:NADH-quinone oxidoreductase subunit L
MTIEMKTLYLIVPLAPLAGALLAGLFGWLIGRTWSHRITIMGVAISC